jgi:ATP-dependent exoDNAse (exonuclease V) beta subunit
LESTTSFSIYNASAGSGKTFTLVKAYLTKLILSNRPDFFKHILAITFTNKAVGEMKERILESLFAFASEKILKQDNAMFSIICSETELSKPEVHKRAKRAVNYILHNYSSFDVETIDRFNHRLIRTFARDLKLPTNFEVNLDVQTLLAEAIDRLISQVGLDSNLTSLILDFSFEKVEDDKSWDISSDLKKISKLLYNENDLPHVEKLKNKSLSDFVSLKKHLIQKKKQLETDLVTLANGFFKLLSDNNLANSDFSGSYLPKYFQKICDKNFDVLTGAGWQQSLGEKSLYPQKTSAEAKSTLDTLSPQIVTVFNHSKALIFQIQFIETLLRNVNALSLINSIYKEYITLQVEKNVLPISEFNSRIHNQIKDQPAPFIYERLGERYKHYFIDEFQDTSQLQWNNLKPLIENALSLTDEKNTPGSLLLVGDAKQSIYRWRGGDPDQFITLYGPSNPFPSAKKEVRNLETNFRSYDEVIDFNNRFFTYVSNKFVSGQHQQLYALGNSQKTNSKEGGYISISFLEAGNKTESDEAYPSKVLEIINAQLEKGYSNKDICILVRKNSQGIVLAEYLSTNEIQVISSEALLLESAPEIGFIINILKIIQNFEDKKAKASSLYFLHTHLKTEEEKHDFIDALLPLSEKLFGEALKSYNVNFDFKTPTTTPLYDLCERICQNFFLSEKRVAYLQSFLELVFEFSSKESTTINDFLEFWETKKGKTSVEMASQLDAVNIMTVHKAKGLEFPVVIYPYADDDMYSFRFDKIWFPLDEQDFSGFTEMLVPVTKNLENFGEQGEELYNEHKQKAELDTINVIYVAMTRAVEQLFILSNLENIEKENYTTSLFHDYLKNQNLWQDNKTHYDFGNPNKQEGPREAQIKIESITTEKFVASTPYKNTIRIATNKSALWDTQKEKAIEKGDLIHDLLSVIVNAKDIDNALELFLIEGRISGQQSQMLISLLEKIISHPLLSPFYEDDAEAVNEKEIFTKEGESLRPDRINFISQKSVAIIDYKTGAESPAHRQQIEKYGSVLSDMGYEIKDLLLVYIKEKIEVIQIKASTQN